MSAGGSRAKRTVAQEIVAVLGGAGVEVVFGLPGVHNLTLFEALDASEIRVVVVRHEASAAYAADAVGRLTGSPGVAVTTSGPGAANTVAAMGEAQASRSPMLHITTTVARRHLGSERSRGILHEHPRQREIFVPVAKLAEHVDQPGAVGAAMRRALSEAAAPPQGPAYLQLPTDLLDEEVAGTASGPASTDPTPASGGGDLGEVARLLQEAERPAIWVGSGAGACGGAVVELAERLGAPVVLTHSAKRRWDSSPHALVLDHPPHEPPVTQLLADSDVVLVLGSDLDGMMTQEFRLPLTRIARVDVEVERARGESPYRSEIAVVGDAAEVTRGLLELIGERDGWGPVVAPEADGRARRELDADSEARGGLGLVGALDAALADRVATVVCDMAMSGYWTGGYLPLRPRRRLLYPLGWGTLGFALPASIGAAALPGAGSTVTICGDGGILFAVGELATLAQEGLDVTVIVHNDSCYGMLRYDEQRRFGRSFAVDLEAPDFVALARSFGIEASRTDLADGGLEEVIAASLELDGPSLVEVTGELSPPRVTSARFPLKAAPPPKSLVGEPRRPTTSSRSARASSSTL